MFIFFQQAPSIKSQSSDTPLEVEPSLCNNPEGQVTMHKELEIHQSFTEQYHVEWKMLII